MKSVAVSLTRIRSEIFFAIEVIVQLVRSNTEVPEPATVLGLLLGYSMEKVSFLSVFKLHAGFPEDV